MLAGLFMPTYPCNSVSVIGISFGKRSQEMNLIVKTNSFIFDPQDDMIKKLIKLVANYSTNTSNVK